MKIDYRRSAARVNRTLRLPDPNDLRFTLPNTLEVKLQPFISSAYPTSHHQLPPPIIFDITMDENSVE
jgi:hypothetical protein